MAQDEFLETCVSANFGHLLSTDYLKCQPNKKTSLSLYAACFTAIPDEGKRASILPIRAPVFDLAVFKEELHGCMNGITSMSCDLNGEWLAQPFSTRAATPRAARSAALPLALRAFPAAAA